MASKSDRFYPLKSQPKRKPAAAVATIGHGGPDGHGYTVCVSDLGTVSFSAARAALDEILSPPLRGFLIYAFDLEQTISVLTQGDFTRLECTFTGNGLLWIEQSDDHGHKWRIWDVCNLLPGVTRSQMGLMVGMKHWPLPPHLDRWLVGNRPASELTGQDLDDCRNIARREAQILYETIQQIQDELLSVGAQLRPTISGVSMDLFRRKFMRKSWPVVDGHLNALARPAYFGGRTEPYKLGRVDHLNGYDISSLYPSVMATGQYPYPATLSYEDNPAQYAHLIEREGVSYVTVEVSEADPPILPARLAGQLFFPTGKFEGAWTNRELRYAVDNGVKILDCNFVIWSGITYSPFDEFISTLYNLRVLSASDSPIREQMYKRIMNAAYGRYGLNPDNELYTLMTIPDNPDWDALRGAYLYEIDKWLYALVPRTDFPTPAYANAFIAAHITTDARLKMHSLISQSLDGLAYTDTDSLWTTEQVAVGDGLGQLRQTHNNVDMWIVAPKEYAIFHNEGLIEAHAKGIPEAHREMYLKMGSVLVKQPRRIKDGLKRGGDFGVYGTVRKKRQENVPKRAPLGLKSSGLACYSTRPWVYSELRSLLG